MVWRRMWLLVRWSDVSLVHRLERETLSFDASIEASGVCSSERAKQRISENEESWGDDVEPKPSPYRGPSLRLSVRCLLYLYWNRPFFSIRSRSTKRLAGLECEKIEADPLKELAVGLSVLFCVRHDCNF